MSQLIFNDEGRPINSRCSIDQTKEGWNIILESRGGRRGTPKEKNTDYSQGLTLIISRLAGIGAIISTARLETSHLIKRGISESDRRLSSELLVYPLTLTLGDVTRVVGDLKRTQATVGSETKGGHNNTRRLLLSVQIPGRDVIGAQFADYVTGTIALGPISDADLADAIGTPLDVRSIADARKWILAIIVRRQGQLKFRGEVLRAYGERCAVTNCDAEPVLEAAHIVPYRGVATNVVGNGLLLRSDIHTLFDRGLLGVAPQSWTIVVHPALLGTVYGPLNASPFRLPDDPNDWPDVAALTDHMVASGLQAGR